MPCLLFLISYSYGVFVDFQIKLRDSLYDSLNSLFCGISGSLPRQWWYMPSLSPYSNKVLICGAHRWETANTYLQGIYCIVKPWIQRNKSISQIKMCMCGEWMVYGDNGDNGENNGESLILLLLFWGDTYLSCTLKLFEGNEMLYIFFFFLLSLRWVSCTPNSTVKHLSIFTSRLTFSFLSRFQALAPFYFLVFIFFRALTLLE